MIRLKYIYLLVCATLLFDFTVCSQFISVSAVNYFKYGTGFENYGEANSVGRRKKEYFDNYLETKFFLQNITLGMRLDVSNPPEYGIPFRGIKKKFIEYSKDGISLRVGDLYTLFSRGLSLNLFENRNLAYDTNLEGLKFEYRTKILRLELVGGTINFLEPSTLYDQNQRFENYNIRSGSLELYPLKFLSFGGNFVWAESNLPTPIPDIFDNTIVKIPEFFIKMNTSYFDVYASYAIKNTKIGSVDSATGSGFYSSLSHTGSGYGVTLEYKDYRFDIVDPFQRSAYFRPTRSLPFQNPPIVHKEHTFTLVNRYPHVVDFNDETGVQLDAFIAINSILTLNTNFAIASRHYQYQLDLPTFTLLRSEKGNPFLPSLSNERSPFWEIYFDIEYYFKDDSYFRLGFDRRAEIQFEILHPTKKVQQLRSTTIPFEIQYVLNHDWSVKTTTESQWIYKFPFVDAYYNHYFSISLTKSPSISVGFRYEFTTSKYEPENRKNWSAIEAGYKFGDNHIVTVAYGRERGGQICSNGICRQVNPFDGFRLSITSTL